jgi:hypothetical protein
MLLKIGRKPGSRYELRKKPSQSIAAYHTAKKLRRFGRDIRAELVLSPPGQVVPNYSGELTES